MAEQEHIQEFEVKKAYDDKITDILVELIRSLPKVPCAFLSEAGISYS